MYRVIVFAGTTEGNEVSRFLAEHGISTCVCVATEYGSRSHQESESLHVKAGRMTQEEMEAFFRDEDPELVLDATHPYAAEVTENISQACKVVQIPYQRVLRRAQQCSENAIYAESTEAAVQILAGTKGNILLTTGSKELAQFTKLPDYQERLYARVLSLPGVIQTCRELGFEGKHLIAMQGPFSKEMNTATLRQYDCQYLVTKDTGHAGGFLEKIEAAQECKVTPVIIGRPTKEEGLTVLECRAMLAKRFSLTGKPKITLLGIGMGSRETLTVEGAQELEAAELLIGASRMVDSVKMAYHDTYCEYRSEAILKYIQAHPEYERIVIVLSGDVGFYSGAGKLLELFKDAKVVCGISSVVYFMAKIGLSWEDAVLTSVHGRSCNLVTLIKQNQKVFSILGTEDGVSELAKKLVYYGMGDVLLYVGENLSYETERITAGKASDLTGFRGSALCVICAYHPDPEAKYATHGMKDEAFLRGKAPMTKSEVRALSLAKLQLKADSVCYDVGAGTGSVAIEMALRASQGTVYAIEKKDEAADLIEENKRRFATDHLQLIRGTAPQALETLPAPTHAFIGGSSGNLQQILEVLLQKNPNVRIVINCITLETVTEALTCIRQFQFAESEIVQIGAAKAKELGRYHMMMGENPIYIITCQNPEEEQEV